MSWDRILGNAPVLLASGAVITVQLGTKRSDAMPSITLQAWIVKMVECARSEVAPRGEISHRYYDEAFGAGRLQQNVEAMQRQLVSVHRGIMDALAEVRISPSTRTTAW
jgi:hypothetical protein